MSIPRVHPARYQTKVHPGLKMEERDDSDKLEKLHESGKIASRIRNHIVQKTKPGTSVWDLCFEADEMIRDAGAVPAFPINVSINHAAAHSTAAIDDPLIIPDHGVVKIDVGVSIDGWIADTAESVDLDGSYSKLVQATVDATNLAVKIIRPGTMTGDLGGVIEKTIRDAGFEPVVELSGHLVDRFIVHAGKTVPCIGTRKGDLVEEGEVYAIETFASTGQGSIHPNIQKVSIFRASPLRVRPRSKQARTIVNHAIHDFKGMPFAARWLTQFGLTKTQIAMGMRELQNIGGLVEYHVLNGNQGDMISQHEHTVYVSKDGNQVTTT
ncbi:MAG: type II methionyl aminopeptidase [Candidatus Heimdallarchaeota archaeon]|nr:type II methionyl aminopeptidase [Candidatus Heimdallarchaeota archaeon]